MGDIGTISSMLPEVMHCSEYSYYFIASASRRVDLDSSFVSLYAVIHMTYSLSSFSEMNALLPILWLNYNTRHSHAHTTD